MVVIALAVGVALGAVAGVAASVALLRRDHRRALDAALASVGSDAQVRLATSEARRGALDADVRDLRGRLDVALDEARGATAALADARVARAGLEAELRDERERADEKLDVLAQARDDLSKHFKALAGDALEVNRQRMAEQHHGALDQILKPLGDKLVAFEKKVEETYDKEAQQRFSLGQEVLKLHQATTRINEEAINLTRALKGEAKTRGNWGEVILERVLERSGLTKGVEYVTQQLLRDDDGAMLRPDVVIHLPEDKHLVIDSKLSLVAYDRYHAADDETTRSHHGRQHLDAVRAHAKALGEKSYHARAGLDSPDFVAMFVPIEPAFGLASSLDPGLFLDAWDRKVVIVTPSTLLALLSTVRTLWQRDKQTRNAIEIAEESGLLHDQFVLVIEALQTLGKQLRSAQKAFELTENRLVDGRGNLVDRIGKLREMGAKTKRRMPDPIARRSGGEDAVDDPMDGDGTAGGGDAGSAPGPGDEVSTAAAAPAVKPAVPFKLVSPGRGESESA